MLLDPPPRRGGGVFRQIVEREETRLGNLDPVGHDRARRAAAEEVDGVAPPLGTREMDRDGREIADAASQLSSTSRAAAASGGSPRWTPPPGSIHKSVRP